MDARTPCWNALWPRCCATLVRLRTLAIGTLFFAVIQCFSQSVTPAKAHYVGSETCADCHRAIFDSYMQTDMGRSMSRVTPEHPASKQSTITIQNSELHRSFDVQWTPKAVLQSEYEIGPDGKEVFRNTQPLAYGVGSGHTGISYLVERDGFLYEAPLSYYTATASWDMSPGFGATDLAFNRPALVGCVACHSGQPQPNLLAPGSYQAPPFQELSIGCENCHGPGSMHVAMEAGQIPGDKLHAAIVNPKKLQPWLADNICMNCHQGLSLRVLQPGKTYSDFQPGMPLDNTMALFATPVNPKDGSAPLAPLLEHFSLMSASKCYTASNGKLSCLTCHNPHEQPTGAAAVKYYRERCLTCHTEASCTVPLHVREAKTPANDCQSCHMPKQPITGISHSVLTSHRIVKTADEPFPTASFNAKMLPSGLIHLNAIPGQPDTVPPLTLFRAFAELAPTNPAYLDDYVQSLNALAKTDPKNPEVLSGLGWMHLAKGPAFDGPLAFDEISQAVALGSTRSDDFLVLGQMLTKKGDPAQAVKILMQGISIAPYDERLYQTLTIVYISTQQYDKALTMLRQATGLFPEDATLRSLREKAEQAGTAPAQ